MNPMNLDSAIEFTKKNRRQWRESKGPETIRINCAHALRVLGDIPAASIKRRHYITLQTELEEEGMAPGTINRICAVVHTVLSCLHLHEFIDAVPTYERLPEPETTRSYYTRDEMKEFINRATELPEDGQLLQDSIQFAIWLAERQGEMLKLKWSDVDFENKQVTFWDTKNDTNHTLPMSSQALLEMLERRHAERIDEDKVFPWPNRFVLLNRFKRLKKLCGHCPVGDKHRLWHTIRHTAATWMVETVPIRTVMTVLNHKNIETTLRYAKTTDEAKLAGLEAITM